MEENAALRIDVVKARPEILQIALSDWKNLFLMQILYIFLELLPRL